MIKDGELEFYYFQKDIYNHLLPSQNLAFLA